MTSKSKQVQVKRENRGTHERIPSFYLCIVTGTILWSLSLSHIPPSYLFIPYYIMSSMFSHYLLLFSIIPSFSPVLSPPLLHPFCFHLTFFFNLSTFIALPSLLICFVCAQTSHEWKGVNKTRQKRRQTRDMSATKGNDCVMKKGTWSHGGEGMGKVNNDPVTETEGESE